MHPNDFYAARISLERQRELIGAAERARSLRVERAHRTPSGRRRLAAWLIRWAHRLDPEAARSSRSPRYTG